MYVLIAILTLNMNNLSDPIPQGIQVSETDGFKIAQAIYNAVTGKTEKLTKFYDKNFRVDMNALRQLDAKLRQMRTQWHVAQSSDSITIHHNADNKDQFSSFERFGIYDSSRAEPVESIVYQHNFLIAMTGIGKAQPYTATVRIASRAAMFDKLKHGGPPPAFFRLFQRGTITVEIDYVDYVVARNIQSTLDSWINEIEVLPESKSLVWLQNHSAWAPRAVSFAVFLVAFYAINSISGQLPTSTNPRDAARLVIFGLPFLWLATQLAKTFGGMVEERLDNYAPLSYIDLNVGDKRLADRIAKHSKLSCFTALFWFATVLAEGVGIGLFTSWLYDKFVK